MTETRETGIRPIGWWLKEADARLEAAFDVRLRAYGVSSRRGWQVLASVARAPVRRTTLVSELALFDPPEVSDRLVDDLLDEGWLAEGTGMLRLTAEGEDLHARLIAAVGEIRGWVADALPGDDYATLVNLLRQLVEALPAVLEPEPANR
jgi:hypothetical protein